MDKVNGFTVMLKDDLHPDDALKIAAAIALLTGVIEVRPLSAQPFDVALASSRVRAAMERELWAVVDKIR